MALILAEQSVRHDEIFVFILDDIFKIKHLLMRRGLMLLKQWGNLEEKPLSKSFILWAKH